MLAAAYGGLSLVSFFQYLLDKSAAKTGDDRTPEARLHLLGLLGGWPGALIAQQLFRHKTIKAQFQTVFWASVVFNVVGVLLLLAGGFFGKPD